jgi:hypothetical protein
MRTVFSQAQIPAPQTAMINDPNRLSLNFHYYKTLGNFSSRSHREQHNLQQKKTSNDTRRKQAAFKALLLFLL